MSKLSDDKEIEQAPDEIQQLADALLVLFVPVLSITDASLVASTATLYDRLNEVFPDMYTSAQMVLALQRARFKMYNAGELDVRWLLKER
ncbi:MAG: hypothetical protein Q8J69_07770 [Sphingobacteriaceae bacterium]|nr:hypothetical protein [Sphingobacteriaceae bacterium]